MSRMIVVLSSVAVVLAVGCADPAGPEDRPGPDFAKGGPKPAPSELPVSWTGSDWSYANGVCGTSAVVFNGDGASGDAVLNPGASCPPLTIDIPGIGTRTVSFVNARNVWSMADGSAIRDLSLDVPEGDPKSDACGKLRWFAANNQGATITRSGNTWTVATGTNAYCYTYTRKGYVKGQEIAGASFSATIAALP